MGAFGAAVVPADAKILTHCNAGALATAGYGTALGVIRGAVEAGKQVVVFADETRPFLQGARLTAWELVRDGIHTTVITDNMAGSLMQQGGVNFVVVKYATHIFNPVAFTGLRVGTAAAFLVAFAYARGGFALSRHDVLRLLLLGVLGNGLYQLFFVHGVARTRAGNASLIVGAAPAFIALVAYSMKDFHGVERQQIPSAPTLSPLEIPR